ncbi:hypothetical protein AB0L40_24175 [Patulibacter sp. NPDC049589]|uniref:hypothetical protein n=1 Tax=Patulibacter sp. NPDC049589 TaxID=3154731 RepID=UPI0034427C0B
MLGTRSAEFATGVRVLEQRLHRRLRHDEGRSYQVGAGYERWTADDAEVLVYADAQPEDTDAVRRVAVGGHDDVAQDLEAGRRDRPVELGPDAVLGADAEHRWAPRCRRCRCRQARPAGERRRANSGPRR